MFHFRLWLDVVEGTSQVTYLAKTYTLLEGKCVSRTGLTDTLRILLNSPLFGGLVVGRRRNTDSDEFVKKSPR
jgi:hypothetical protein